MTLQLKKNIATFRMAFLKNIVALKNGTRALNNASYKKCMLKKWKLTNQQQKRQKFQESKGSYLNNVILFYHSLYFGKESVVISQQPP